MKYRTHIVFAYFLVLAACTDYESLYDADYEEWLDEQASSAKMSSSQKLSSSSSAKRSSSSEAVQSSSQQSSSSSALESSKSDSLVSSSSYSVVIDSITDARDSAIYKTVTIGKQIWMAENLNYNYNEGSAKSYCYNDDADNCKKYGRLYTWAAAIDSAAKFDDVGKGCGKGVSCDAGGVIQGACPAGWHLPSNYEWSLLIIAVGGSSSAGQQMKSESGWNNGGKGIDSFGFTILPAGYYLSEENYYLNLGYGAYFWTSVESDSDNAYRAYLNNEASIDMSYANKQSAFAIRCIKD